MPHRLLAVTAHPDDESGAFGGALMLAHRAGAETFVLCFTDGQAAHFRGDAAPDADLGKLRRAEMDAASAVLCVTQHEVLTFPDGELVKQNFQEMVGIVVEHIRRWRPEVVLTFGGDGAVNLHRDHTVVSAVTTMAFHWAGRAEMYPDHLDTGLDPYSPQKLYYSSPPFVSVRDRPELTATAATVPWSLTLELGDLGERKLEAFRKHSSQQGVLERVGERVKESMKTERYLLAAKRGLGPVRADAGLWDGIEGRQ
ncbi:MAG TPA: PIG-L family deacetylase [Acidobacteriaceae bacterium]|nr:PIG-L family deacetylase [Acidobacteriaceae bacterium]